MMRIKSFSSNAGFLERARVQFHPALTCVIGARGTCKSTLIETLRFIFNAPPERVEVMTSRGGLIDVTLGAGTATCELATDTGGNPGAIVLEREKGEPTRIFQDGVRELTNRDLLGQIDIYSQGDLHRIAEDDSLRIELIDKANRSAINELLKRRKDLTARVLQTGYELRTHRSKVSNLKQEVQPLEQLRNHLQTVLASAPAIPPELETERQLYTKRANVLQALDQVIGFQAQITSSLAPIRQWLESLRSLKAHIEDQSLDRTEVASGVVGGLIQHIVEVNARTELIRAMDLQRERGSLSEEFERLNDQYYSLRREQQHVNDSLKQQQQLHRQIEHLERLQGELDLALETESQLLASRQNVRDEIAGIDSQIFDLRIREIERINQAHSDRVFLALQMGAGSSAYIQSLSHLLNGSRIRNQPEVAADLARTFPPSDLINIVESGSGQQISTVLGRDIGQMNRVVAHLSDHADLYALESEMPDSRLEITFYDGAEPKPVESLSKGQKATALLPLILRPLPYPLIIDQPEDDLDNSFIFHSLIQTVRDLKQHRQIIFVTHNANIPVLGEADRIIVMDMESPTRAAMPVQGDVEACKHHILELLEGGQEAFREREARYRDIL